MMAKRIVIVAIETPQESIQRFPALVTILKLIGIEHLSWQQIRLSTDFPSYHEDMVLLHKYKDGLIIDLIYWINAIWNQAHWEYKHTNPEMEAAINDMLASMFLEDGKLNKKISWIIQGSPKWRE